MKPRENSKIFLKVALFSLIVILAILAVSRSAIIRVVERATEDLRFRMRRSAAVDPRLSLILVDSATMDRYGYPVPRRYYGVAAKAICDAGASVVAIDRTFEARDPVDDVGGAILAEVVKQHKNIVFAWYGRTEQSIGLAGSPVVPRRFAMPHEIHGIGIKPYETSLNRQEVSLPYYEALRNVSWLGGIMVPQEVGGHIKKVPLVVKHGDHIYPAISLVTVCIALGTDLGDVIIGKNGISIPTQNGVIDVPTDEKGRIRVNYLGYNSVFFMNVHSLTAVYESIFSDDPTIPLESFKDGIVLIGNADIMGADMYYTPFGRRIPGVAIHAMVINSILQRRFINIAPWYYDLLILAFCVFGISYAQKLFSPRVGLICLVALLVCICTGAFALFQFKEVLINLSQPTSGAILAFAGMTFYNYMSERKRVRQIKQIFGKHVSQEVMDQLIMEADGQVPMAQQVVSALFADVSDHSAWARNLQASRFAEELNECLMVMIQAALENGGTINVFLGDGVLVIYNAPITQDDHALKAVKTGIAIQKHTLELNRKRAERGEQPIAVRVGINTGIAMAGTLGSKDRLEYTVVGDTINMAKRAEGECEPGRVAVTDGVIYETGEAVRVEPMGLRPVKGREDGLMLYHVIGVEEGDE